VRVRDVPSGALNLYSSTVCEWSPTDVAVVRTVADLVGAGLENAQALRATSDLASQLQRALDSRVLIEQAKGIVAAASDVSVEDAFERIRRYARSHNQRVHAVAADVIRAGLRP
jgi:AmiR/NasT family two-component response regulator